jgi:hypothetical protein
MPQIMGCFSMEAAIGAMQTLELLALLYHNAHVRLQKEWIKTLFSALNIPLWRTFD